MCKYYPPFYLCIVHKTHNYYCNGLRIEAHLARIGHYLHEASVNKSSNKLLVGEVVNNQLTSRMAMKITNKC